MTHHLRQTLNFRKNHLIPLGGQCEASSKRCGLLKEVQSYAKSRDRHLLTQVCHLSQILSLKKLIRKREGRSILKFTNSTLLSSNNENAKKYLGHILFLTQNKPEALLEIIKTESAVSKIERLNKVVCELLQKAQNRIIKTHAMHVKCPIQNSLNAAFEKLCSEMAKTLVLENGSFNLNIIELAKEKLIPEILRGLPQLTHLNCALSSLDQICLSEVNTDWNRSLEFALKIYLDNGEKKEITLRDKKMLFLSALFGFEGNFSELLDKVAKHLSVITKQTFPNLEYEFTVTNNAQIMSKKGKNTFLFHSPGIVKACEVLNIQNVKETLLNILNRMPEKLSLKNLLRQLANYAYMQQEFALSMTTVEKEKYTPEELFQKAKIAFIVQVKNPLLLCLLRVVKEKNVYFSEIKKRSIFVEILGSTPYLRRACFASSSDKIFPNRSN